MIWFFLVCRVGTAHRCFINKTMNYLIVFICLLGATLTALSPLPVHAEENCSLEEVRQAEAEMRKAEETERANKLTEAFDMAAALKIKCLMGDGVSRQKNLKKRLGLKLGAQEEQQGRLASAYHWYESTGNLPEAGRIKLKQSSSK